jgi:hypothetical protein
MGRMGEQMFIKKVVQIVLHLVWPILYWLVIDPHG